MRFGEVEMAGDLFSARELLAVYDPLERHRVTASGMARELRRQGAPLAARGEKLRAPDGRAEAFFALRGEGWAPASVKKCQGHLEGRGKT